MTTVAKYSSLHKQTPRKEKESSKCRFFSKYSSSVRRALLVEGMDEKCIEAFNVLKEKLITAPIMAAPDWTLPFEVMCDASDEALGAVLGQRKDKKFHTIYYSSKTLVGPQLNYTTTKKEFFLLYMHLTGFDLTC